MAICGFAFLAIDTEHSPIDIEGSMGMLQAIKSGNPNCKALIRVSGNSYSEIKRYMDAGANGIICPMVNSREEAQVLILLLSIILMRYFRLKELMLFLLAHMISVHLWGSWVNWIMLKWKM